MRLETLSLKKIVGKFTDDLYGTVTPVNDKLFKFVNANGPLFIKKVDLGKLFDNTNQSVVDIEFGDCITEMPTGAPEIVSEGFPDSVPAMDTLGVHFTNWKRLVGLYDLPREEVDLCLMEGVMIIDARRAVLYSGIVSVFIE
jgi:hypothetical protein